jgi:ABC-type multidrug transport system fused ATPase/permease subunit
MKRTPELRTLSEDHHHGLVHARRLRRAAEGDEAQPAEATAKDFLDFCQRDTAIHFRKEEEVLLPMIARHGGDVTMEPLVEMLEGHACVRGLVMRLSDEVVGGKVQPETLREIREQLEAHVRLEERVVFPPHRGVAPGGRPDGPGGPAGGKGGGPTRRAVGPRGRTLVRALAGSRRQRGRQLRLRHAPPGTRHRSALEEARVNDAPLVETRGLTKRYGSITAVEELDLTASNGEVYGTLGPNGAGKTTTPRMLLWRQDVT